MRREASGCVAERHAPVVATVNLGLGWLFATEEGCSTRPLAAELAGSAAATQSSVDDVKKRRSTKWSGVGAQARW